MRTHRIRTAVLAGTTATLALGLAACGSPGSGNGGDKADAKTGTTRTVETGTGAGADSVTVSKASAARGTAKATATRQCNGDEISYSVVHRFAKQQGEHLLITATNADAAPCWVTSYPSVMLGDTTKVLPHSAKDAPGGAARITVRPGAKVYAAVNLFTDSARPHTSGDLSIALRDRTGDTGPGTDQAAFDGKGVPSKFTWTSADVTNWNKTKPYDY
ncbi:DUF4232 domain-containing protein [Streptomyces kanamyceticus]|uniref:DUF4232 domain-containing protein n=1 Tax=Streptomyces kanamyceticus TaxID=1967 RepID=A0A5J6G2H2_STRKN|nr:DUF4232 domain-containing protein [Streptomyces kanamyceticus]QEU89769.1 DUF4232 domain-containing protein [Streptomyces kanamyceticus]